MNAKAFLDTNVLIYAVAKNDPRSSVAQQLLLRGGRISVQVLNEFAAVARGKLQLGWPVVRAALADIRQLCADPIAVDLAVHDDAMELAQTHGLSIYDALVVAAARQARCEVLYSEDMQHGRRFDGGLRIENPFVV